MEMNKANTMSKKLCEIISESGRITLYPSEKSDKESDFKVDLYQNGVCELSTEGIVIKKSVRKYWRVDNNILYIFGERNNKVNHDDVECFQFRMRYSKFFIGEPQFSLIFDHPLYHNTHRFIFFLEN